LLFKSSIGIEVNQHQINIAYLKGSFKGENLASESSFLVDETQSKTEKLADISNFINGFIDEHRISAPDIYIGIPGQCSIVREIEFPLAVKENLRATLEYEIEKYIPMSPENIYFDFSIISEDKAEEKIKLLLVAVKKETFEYYIQIAELLDMGASGIEIVPAAVSNYYLYHHDVSEEEPVVLIYSWDKGYDIMIINHRALVYTKSFVFSGPDEEQGSLISAQLIKLKKVFLKDENNVQLILCNVLTPDNLSPELYNEFKSVVHGDKQSMPYRVKSIPALGLALKGIQKLPIQLNLMPVNMRKKPDRTGIYIMIVLLGLLILSGVVWSVSHVMNQQQQLNVLETEFSRLKVQASAVEKIESETEQMKDKIEYLRSLNPGNIYVIEIVKELSDTIPETAWITKLRLSGDEMSIYGMAESASELISLLESSSFFEDVKFLAAIRKGRDGNEVFRIGLKVHAER